MVISHLVLIVIEVGISEDGPGWTFQQGMTPQVIAGLLCECTCLNCAALGLLL